MIPSLAGNPLRGVADPVGPAKCHSWVFSLFDLAVWVLHTSATGNRPAFHKLELEER
ncbi:hypothetical protein CY34DRAFT_808390 [Suillus luteus UH-Slu-Lm8-n1]|uniref:Uncharacterized protein n=1 Tax=Suillus luteus UH-Slu-Lm8-n1 TaxID=930992 RepID=A0A0D0B657_9AGAM|nr:hypothetical protein CY34DRAFT_808390 [Suillus luteus UH-Slu-Lm8-n1]